jgi:hypothetical protein
MKYRYFQQNECGFTVIEGLLIFLTVGIIGGTGWYVWHNQKIQKINDYTTCKNANGKLDQNPQDYPNCTMYGHTYVDYGKLKWNLGIRYSDISHNDNLSPATIENASLAPIELVHYLQKDNASCVNNSPSNKQGQVVYKIIKVTDNKYARMMYGCGATNANILAENSREGWRLINPTNMFTDDGVPACSMINAFKISSSLEPKCANFTNSGEYTTSVNKNP